MISVGTVTGASKLLIATTEEFYLKISSELMLTHWVINIQMTKVAESTLQMPPMTEGIVFLP